MKTNALATTLTILSVSVLLASCREEVVTLPVTSLDAALVKQTTVHYYASSYTSNRTSRFAPVTPDSITFLKATLYPGNTYQETYDYDSRKRIVKHQTTDLARPTDTILGVNSTITYKYIDDQTMSGYSSKFGVFVPVRLNPDGFITGGGSEGYTYSYTYDQNGYRVKEEYQRGSKLESIVSNGNIIQQNRSDQGVIADRIRYQYDLKKPAIPDPFKNLNGKPSHNLRIGVINLRPVLTQTGAVTEYKTVTTYTYEYDQRGLPKRRTAYSEEGYTATWITKGTEKRVAISDFEFAQ